MKLIVSLDRDEDGVWIAECSSIPGCLPHVPGGVSARVRHRKKNEKKPTRKAFEKAWCHVDTRGSGHSIFQKGDRKTQVPRHNEIVDELARKICKDLGLPFVR